MVNQLKYRSKIGLIIGAGLILLMGWIETPPGILGKADAVGYAVCQRIDLRSFHIGIRQLPLCSRCTGQYIGAMIGLLFQALYSRRRSGFPAKVVLVVLGALCLAYAIDGVNSYLYLPPFVKVFPSLPHLYQPTNSLRLLTGTGMGLVIAMILYPAFVGSLFENPNVRPAIGGFKPLFFMLALSFLVDLFILTQSPYVLYPAALISSGGVVILLSLAYSIVFLRILKQENKLTRLSQAGIPLFVGLMVTMSQLAIFDLVRFIITGTWSGISF
jgi:uncharacterized membrane protein